MSGEEQEILTNPESLERALMLDRARREQGAREALEAALREIQERYRVDPVIVLRVLPSGACAPGIEWRSR